MWNLGQRDIIVLVSVISGCAILFNVWGPFIALTIALLLIICACIIISVADYTPFTPHARLALHYLEETGREFNIFIANTYDILREYVNYLIDELKDLYRTHVVARMSQRRRSTYQLSTESYPTPKNPSRYNLPDGLSPIARGSFRPNANNSNLENSYSETNTMILNHGDSLGKVTSTPLVAWKKDDSRNGDIFGANHLGANKTTWTKSSVSQNHTLSRNEDTTYSPEGSPWGTSISPKMRARAGGVKTVQTVAGPLLASTRYNIDPKVYSDVTSPGLTTRLTKYATEANTKLTHQSQYGTGQFPRVNLNSSPTPLINMKNGKMRMPVTVRVAPPENTRYSPPERQKILSNICHAESKTPPSVVQVLREISLKRHASREDVTFELAKKQRTEAVFSDGLENLEEMTQKRARDDSSRSEEEISPQNKSLRPAKRSKMPSCYDILSSLSSSINVTSGIKRKAIDISRSGTPDLGKHFKSLDSSHGDVPAPTSITRTVSEPTKPSKRTLNELDTSRNSDIHSPHKKVLESIQQKGILKSPPSTSKLVNNKAGGDVAEKYRTTEKRDTRIGNESSASSPRVPVKLTDKLFMKAEPQNIDKLKTLIEEHGRINPRFTTNDTDEIKKSDIVNMRQTSMKTRLKSMFDAISGKAPSIINPEVVIQAEEAKAPTASASTISLSSSTSTTNVNTSPIATSAIVPIIGKTKPNTTPAKHVTFQLTTADTSNKSPSADTTKPSIMQSTLTSGTSNSGELKKPDISTTTEKPVVASSLFQSGNQPSSTTSVPAFSFGSSPLSTSFSATTSTTPTTVVKTASFSSPATTVAASVASPPQFNSTQIGNSNMFANITPVSLKSATSTLPTFNASIQPIENNSQTVANNSSIGKFVPTNPTSSPSERFGFGLATNTTETSQGTAADKKAPSPMKSIFGSGGANTTAPPTFSSTTTSSFATTAPPATTSMFSFGGNTATQNTEKKAFAFGAAAASSAVNTTTASSITTSQPVSTAISATPATSGGFSFSTSSAAPTNNPSLFGTVTTASSTPSSIFSTAANTTPAFTFGSNTTATSKSSFSFGTNSTTAPVATSASTGSTITFGQTNPSTTSIFGAPSTTASTTTASSLPSIFGTPTSTVAATTASNPQGLFGTPATSTSAFATPTTASTFGTTSNQPTFAAPSNAFGTQKTMETPAFNANMGAPPAFATTTTGSSLFGDTNAGANTTSTTAAPAFGTSSFGQTKPPPAFSSNPTPAFASGGTGSSLFGSQPATSGAFGAATTVASSSTSMFGMTNTSAPAFGTPTTAPPPFGATNTSTTSFGAATTAIPSFGTINTSTSAFGGQSSAAGTSGNQNFSTPSTAFGAVTTSAPPAFGAANTTQSAFGTSSTSGFGTSTNPPPAFSTGSTSFSGFGNSNNASSPFGSQPTPGTSTFGTPSSTTPAFGSGNNNTSSFTFGGSQSAAQPVQQQQQQNAVFAFGGNNPTPANNAPSAATPFQFGGSAPQTGGFNFSGAPSTPALNFSKDGATTGAFAAPGANSFSAPSTGGMFSIGSGSTGPRSRPSRRKQR